MLLQRTIQMGAGVLSMCLGALAFQACSSDSESLTTSVPDAATDAVTVTPDAGSTDDAGLCVRCAVIIDADRRPAGAVGTCANNQAFGQPSGTSSKNVLDIAFACVCTQQCATECADTCASGTALAPLCAACAGSKCGTEFAACNADDPDKDPSIDSGVTPEVDSGVIDSGAEMDSGIMDAATEGG